MTAPVEAGTCKDCRQGYTMSGFAAYPDHIELCPLHAAASYMLDALRHIENEAHGERLWSEVIHLARDAKAKAQEVR